MTYRTFRTRGDPIPFWVIVIIGVSFSAMWSSAFPVAKILVASVPPFSVSAVRFIFASLVVGAIALALGQKIPTRLSVWKSITLLGICQNTLFLGLGFVAITRIPAGIAAIIASTAPLVVAALASLFLSERVGRIKAAGLFIGFAGVVWILWFRISGGLDAAGMGLAILGVLAFSTATLTVKRSDFGTGLLMVVSCQMMIGGLGCIPLALLFDAPYAVTINSEVILAFLWLALITGGLATVTWFFLVRYITATSASSFHFLNPVFGTLFAFIMLGETLSALDLLGIALVAAGILIVNRQDAPAPGKV